MRRFIFTLLVLLLATTFAFTTSKPSLDGRAVVAEEGVLPRGLFAKTVGYLPGDSVSVTNPATGITISVLILGSIDPSAGVAILLSPEAADKLFITPESNTQVKITKRSGMLDESVAGSGTIIGDTPSDTLIPNGMKEELDAKLASVDEALGTSPTEEEPEVAVAEPEPVETMPEPVETPVEESVPPVTAPVENTADLALVPLTGETTPGSDLTDEYTVTSMEEVPLNHVLAESNPVYIVESVDENEEMIPLPILEPEDDTEVAITEEIPEEPLVEEISEEESLVLVPVAPSTTEIPEEESLGLVPEEPPVEEIPEEESLVLVPVDPTTTEIPEEESLVLVPVDPEPTETVEPAEAIEPLIPEDTEIASTVDEDLVDPFAPIILVPTDEHPPLEPATALPEPDTLVPPPTETSVAKNVLPSSNKLGTDSKNLVKSLSELEKGKYYVQIATSSDQESIDNILQEYSVKYPMVVVPMKSGKSMQMMIGPLNVDEYGAVLAKFKKLGYKDSFLRKIR